MRQRSDLRASCPNSQLSTRLPLPCLTTPFHVLVGVTQFSGPRPVFPPPPSGRADAMRRMSQDRDESHRLARVAHPDVSRFATRVREAKRGPEPAPGCCLWGSGRFNEDVPKARRPWDAPRGESSGKALHKKLGGARQALRTGKERNIETMQRVAKKKLGERWGRGPTPFFSPPHCNLRRLVQPVFKSGYPFSHPSQSKKVAKNFGFLQNQKPPRCLFAILQN